MAQRRSTALRKAIATRMPYNVAMANGRIKYYDGGQPASADDVPSGSLLATFTLSAGSFTGETRATVVLILTGSAGSIDTLTAGGGIPLIDSAVSAGSLALMADALAAAINAKQQIPFFTAVSDGISKITISGPVGMGADCNGLTLEHTETTTTVTVNAGDGSNFGQAVTSGAQVVGVSSINGLNMAYPDVTGILSKEATAWQAVAIKSGTVGWARWEFDPDDDQSSSTLFRRMDFSVGTSGTDLIVGTTTITISETYSIDSGTFTLPAA